MTSIPSLKKQKVQLQDYDYQGDIASRRMLANISVVEVEILEEILFNRLEIPLSRLEKSFPDLPDGELYRILEKLAPLQLYKLSDSSIQVDKEKRKYYETQLVKFDENFRPDMDSLLHLLKKVPIHILPVWYSISRSSNNIFESILDKFLSTPQIYQRHLAEMSSIDPIFASIIQDVFSAENGMVYAEEIQKKYGLSHEEFHEYVLYLEFHFICTLGYTRTGDFWEEILTPFYEWKAFTNHIEETKPEPIQQKERIQQEKPNPFAFVEDMNALLLQAANSPFALQEDAILQMVHMEKSPFSTVYVNQVLEKIIQLQLGSNKEGVLIPSEHGLEFTSMNSETKALYLYRHPLNCIAVKSPEKWQEKHQREVEKALKYFIDYDWIFFDAFVASSMIAFREEQKVVLTKKGGKQWRYLLPSYSEEDVTAIKACIFEGLFACGFVHTGILHNKPCFSLTNFGKTFFG